MRDEKGRFVKGHTLFPTANGIKNGAKKTITGRTKDALALAEVAMPAIIEEMIRRAQNPKDRDCQRAAEYLIDRIYGRAKQSHVVGSEGGLPLVIRVVYEKLELERETGGTDGQADRSKRCRF